MRPYVLALSSGSFENENIFIMLSASVLRTSGAGSILELLYCTLKHSYGYIYPVVASKIHVFRGDCTHLLFAHLADVSA